MTITLTNMPSVTTDVAVALLDQSLLKRSSYKESADGNTRTTIYTYAGADPKDNTTVQVQWQYAPAQDICRHSVRLTTNEKDDSSGEVVVRPIEVVVAFNTPGRFIGDTVATLQMIGTAYSLMFKTLTSKVPQPGLINSFNLPVTDSLYP